jgi:hypothetical protein
VALFKPLDWGNNDSKEHPVDVFGLRDGCCRRSLPPRPRSLIRQTGTPRTTIKYPRGDHPSTTGSCVPGLSWANTVDESTHGHLIRDVLGTAPAMPLRHRAPRHVSAAARGRSRAESAPRVRRLLRTNVASLRTYVALCGEIATKSARKAQVCGSVRRDARPTRPHAAHELLAQSRFARGRGTSGQRRGTVLQPRPYAHGTVVSVATQGLRVGCRIRQVPGFAVDQPVRVDAG